MRSKPLALDLFCGAGGATRGLQLAGFEVLGIDHMPQPRYVGEHFVQADALRPPVRLRDFNLIWASPPCQAFTAYKRRPGHVAGRADLISATRRLLRASGCPFVIENIPGAPLQGAFTLCGSSFGLDLRRHRLFEASDWIMAPPCHHGWQTPRFPQATNRKNARRSVEIGVWRIPLHVQRQAMGIEWMTLEELSEAVPPAYSEFIGRSFLERHRQELAQRTRC